MAMQENSEIRIEWRKPPAALTAEAFGRSTQLFAANEFKRIMEPYVPADNNLILSDSARATATETRGAVLYNTPYAHYQYVGRLFVDPQTGKGAFTNGERFWSRPGVAKIPSSRRLKYKTFRHPLATSEWDKAALTARGPELIDAVTRFVERSLDD
jgi:hypothetical protein